MTEMVLIPARPNFLDRRPGDIKKTHAPRVSKMTTPGLRAATVIERAKRVAAEVRPTVLHAVAHGAATFGQIRKATELDDDTIRSALTFYIKKRGNICRHGRRYALRDDS